MKLRIIEHRGRYTVEKENRWLVFSSWVLWSVEHEEGRFGTVNTIPLDFSTASEAKQYIDERFRRAESLREHHSKRVVEELEMELDM
jgi:hypothetical protein